MEASFTIMKSALATLERQRSIEKKMWEEGQSMQKIIIKDLLARDKDLVARLARSHALIGHLKVNLEKSEERVKGLEEDMVSSKYQAEAIAVFLSKSKPVQHDSDKLAVTCPSWMSNGFDKSFVELTGAALSIR